MLLNDQTLHERAALDHSIEEGRLCGAIHQNSQFADYSVKYANTDLNALQPTVVVEQQCEDVERGARLPSAGP